MQYSGPKMDDQSVFLKLLLTFTLISKCASALNPITADKLYLRYENLTTVPSHINVNEANANNVTKAIFSHNQFNSLTSGDFEHLARFPNIKYVFFDHNIIVNIEGDTFARIPKLKHLDLSHNRLKEIPDELYDDLVKIKPLQYVNLKRNPIKNYKNIDRLIASGVQIEYDGVLGREKRLRMRNRRVASSESTNYDNDVHDDEDRHTMNKEDLDKLESYIRERDEEQNFTVIEDKPIKAFVVDHKTDHNTDHKTPENPGINSNFLGSIIFNFLAAFLVLVALPIAMVVYYFMHRDEGFS